MTDRTMKEKAAKLQEVNAEIARLQEQADKLKGDITAEMERRAVDELQAGNSVIRWREVTSTRFDSKLFREAHSGLYEQYAKTSTARRFTLVPA
jgi:predicted phage-related endonuclease